MYFSRLISVITLFAFLSNSVSAGLLITESNGITLTGKDGITFAGTSGVSVSGADGYLNYVANGISLTDINGVPVASINGVSVSGADGVTRVATNGVSVSGADGVSVSGADGVSVSGADGVSVSGADGEEYSADYIFIQNPNGVSVSGADDVALNSVNGLTMNGPNGVSVSGADGVSVSGADGVSVSGADSIKGFSTQGLVFELTSPTGVSVSGADGVSISGADGVSVSGADSISVFGEEEVFNSTGFQSLDPELAIQIDQISDDSSVNAVVTFHQYPSLKDIAQIQAIGVLGGTKYEVIPSIVITATKAQLIQISQLSNVRSIYGNRTVNFNADPYFEKTVAHRIAPDAELTSHNSGVPVSGRNVTVAVLDTGVNRLHSDLSGKVVQNVKLLDIQSVPGTFSPPAPIENLDNTDLVSGHGTFVAGIIAGNGVSSGGVYDGVAPGANILGLSAGEYNLTHVLAGLDYVLKHRVTYNVRVINCSFSADTIYDAHDPVNIGTRMLADNGVSVVFSAGNKGDGSGTLNPYALAPWNVSVGSSNRKGEISSFSSRGTFGRTGPTIVAPGESIVSLRAAPSMTGVLGVGGADPNRLTTGQIPFYTTASGTSFSAPQAAGVIAMMVEANPSLTPRQIKEILIRSATRSTKTYFNESGAGMLNAYGAVLEAAFPTRRMGSFRARLNQKNVAFENDVSQIFGLVLQPGSQLDHIFSTSTDTIRTTSHIAWSIGINDLGLRVFDGKNQLVGESNFLNITALTGRSEKVSVGAPETGQYRVSAYHTGGIGTPQTVTGALETTSAVFGPIDDISGLSATQIKKIKAAVQSFEMSPRSGKFQPDSNVTRFELAETLVRGGFAQQYLAGSPMFTDVDPHMIRSAVESVQNHYKGPFFYDATQGSQFRPFANTSRLTAAIAMVRAAGLEGEVGNVILRGNIADRFMIPRQYHGHVAIALRHGLLKKYGKRFRPNDALTRIELAEGLSVMQ